MPQYSNNVINAMLCYGDRVKPATPRYAWLFGSEPINRIKKVWVD